MTKEEERLAVIQIAAILHDMFCEQQICKHPIPPGQKYEKVAKALVVTYGQDGKARELIETIRNSRNN